MCGKIKKYLGNDGNDLIKSRGRFFSVSYNLNLSNKYLYDNKINDGKLIVLNASNEVAVKSFLSKDINYLNIKNFN